MADEKKLFKVTIDNITLEVEPGTSILMAARKIGGDVAPPAMCYYTKLKGSGGKCRTCLVEVAAGSTADPRPMPKLVASCRTNVMDGMVVKNITSEKVIDARNGVVEFLLINHPLDCPICDQAGECTLQEQATGYGRGYSRYIEKKNVKPKRTELGPRVTLDDERCILCSRCVRFCTEVAKDDVLGFVDRGSYSTLTCYPGRELENNYSLNTVDICPVGALTSTDFRFKMRVWFLKQTPGIDTESSVGANTLVWSREGVIYRITPRRNDEVNDTWMADSGRTLYKDVGSPDRLTQIKRDGVDSTLPEAAAAAAWLFRTGSVAFVGSGRSSVEEQFV